MGKSRRSSRPTSSNNGPAPTVSNMDIPQGTSTVDMLPEENQGAKTTLQQNEEKIQAELNELYGQIYDVEMERNILWREMDNNRKRLEELLSLQNIPDGSGYPTLQKQINDAQKEYDRVTELYNRQNTKFQEMNRRIHTLETGFDTGDNSNFVNELESGEDEHGLWGKKIEIKKNCHDFKKVNLPKELHI